MLPRIRCAHLLLLLVPFSARAGVTCADVLKSLGNQLVDPTCFQSADLTTANPSTTPANNSLTGLPAGAFTPVTDRGVIAPSAGKRTPITKTVPGVQLNARIASDPAGQARFLLRLPNDWNGRLVVAGASGTRSEFNGDFAWSDYVLQQGYAYASQNKGVLNLSIVTLVPPPPADPLACRLNPASPVFVHFFDNDPGQPFTRWAEFMIKGAQLARDGVKAGYGRSPRFSYAVGTSNGGYQVRRAVELAPDLFDGGVDWEGTFVDEHAPNILSGAVSFWGLYNAQFWEVTQCQWQKRLDPTYDTYGSGTGTYNYVSRLSFSDVGAQFAAFATTGKIRRPLVTVAGTMDALLPIDHHARAYARTVAAASKHGRDNAGARPASRLYEIQNGNHLETFQDVFPQLELIEPHAQRAFDLLVRQVENNVPLPPDQCVPRGRSIADSPAQAGHCASLFVP